MGSGRVGAVWKRGEKEEGKAKEVIMSNGGVRLSDLTSELYR